jgi:hypothetical protein
MWDRESSPVKVLTLLEFKFLRVFFSGHGPPSTLKRELQQDKKQDGSEACLHFGIQPSIISPQSLIASPSL